MSTPWALQILTTDYLIYGKIDSDEMDKFYTLTYAETSSQPSNCQVHLKEATFRPATTLVPLDCSPTDWYASGANAFLVAMPWDEPSMAFLVKECKYKSLIPADLYVGSYLIHGKVWSREKPESGLSILRAAHCFVVQDVRIDCLLPGSQLHGLEAPFAVVRTHLLQCAAVRP